MCGTLRLKWTPSGGNLTYFEILLGWERPCLDTVFDIDDIEACSICWRSWAWQQQQFATGMAAIGVGIRPFLQDGPMGVYDLACKHGFWGLSRIVIAELAGLKGCAVDKSSSLFRTLFETIQQGLGADDSVVLDCIGQCLSDVDAQYSSALVEIDAAIDVLEVQDHKEVTKAQTNFQKEASERQHFSREFVAKRTVVRDLLAKAKAKSKGAERKRARSDAPVPVPPAISQATANLFYRRAPAYGED